MSRFKVSKKAASDIRSIGHYTQKTWGAPQRRVYLTGLERSFERLADNPALGPLRYEIDPPVRVFRYQSHMIVYVEDIAGVLILRVRHQSEDWRDAPV